MHPLRRTCLSQRNEEPLQVKLQGRVESRRSSQGVKVCPIRKQMAP